MSSKEWKAYYFRDKRTGKERNTPVIAMTLAQARELLRRPSPEHAEVISVRKLKPGEAKDGRWSRIRRDGKSPEESKYGHGRGFGPARN